MKNKIYNAIQKGLSNVLVFDDNDSPISYQKSDIDNDAQHLISLDELYDIFKVNEKNIFNYNTLDYISLILDNDTEISLHDYNFNCVPVFLKISNDILKNTDNEIIIACDKKHYVSSKDTWWQNQHEQILPTKYLGDARNAGFNSYTKCQMMLEITKNNPQLGKAVAVDYCNKIKSPLLNYKGYLPSFSQLLVIQKYMDMINYIFKYIGKNALKNLNEKCWLSSTEISNERIQALVCGTPINYFKAYSGSILPLFKKIN